MTWILSTGMGPHEDKYAKHERATFKKTYSSMKTLSLNHLTAKQHMLMALCRDISLLPPLTYIFTSLRKAWRVSMRTSITLYEPQSLRDAFTYFWQKLNSAYDNNSSFEGASQKAVNGDGKDSLLLSALTTARASEYLLCSLWCLVSLYLSYAILDSLMVRWIVKYSTVAAILRMFSMSLIIVTLELLLLSSLSPELDYFLHTWILISCVLTAVYIWQSYLTSDLRYIRNQEGEVQEDTNVPEETEDYEDGEDDADEDSHVVVADESTVDVPSNDSLSDNSDGGLFPVNRPSVSHSQSPKRPKKYPKKAFNFTTKRTIDLYKITVLCVVPVGLASFITMLGLLRNLFIQRLDVEQLERILHEMHPPA
ncbi:AQG_2a_G0046560.mRNA.1.CDS.1 [Saccharomyces cerevisiae]|uniref:N-glycosylation protein EOS1 n=6 Tax=Saccharomyces TaxID=4930 RepID=EOS1_YEAST|nr:Eos1p [Saccharomyces cerevisiae S288C]P53938.1 RecName: Full=N-glycosylation protein EOS1; AltName: Full=ER-localized and oxidants sensitive protein 1 [Saccharomyces cerevisiae S288C]AAZ22528.1 Ynl080cp [Saccharomyces cerevisiae]AHY77014.1 Eos1p [Saccharomyces cerevisiae YJM993]AJP41251.1 Eos1p [Saccharomyces cerevisiae YJM1078]AJT01689.1 Eos1p [Saccharomyces cerevisiae YJM189]AJT02058.1 Eos1p [Saccharomyces cerevisiae YJM193]AJT02802.1 Eos1p [Saccharomyces cerevisiae YJM244]AJT03183.1 E|eukprot:NP_014319.1 Eos1p [Saccharomyces cerevisiae S288C]